MEIHVDHKDRATEFYGQPTMPEILLSRTQIQAVDFLERCAQSLEPLAAVTGAAGMGKTVALNTALARRESAGDRVIRVNNFVAGPLSLHRVLASTLGVAEAAELSAQELEPVLRKALVEAGQSGSAGLAVPPLLAVDDAQSLLPETLRYLCLLAGLREAGRPLLRILLVGRPGFTVRQPILLQFTLEAMRPEATREVIEHGLAAAGVTATEPVVQDLVSRAQGNLRKLNGLLRECVQEAGTQGARKPGARKNGVLTTPSRRQVASQSVRGSTEGRPRGRRTTRRGVAAWLAAPALVAVAIAGTGIAYHNGWLGGLSPAPIGTPPAAPVGATPSRPSPRDPSMQTQRTDGLSPSGSATQANSEPRPPAAPALVAQTPAQPTPAQQTPAQPTPAQQTAAQPSPAQPFPAPPVVAPPVVAPPVVAPPVVAEATPAAPAAPSPSPPGLSAEPTIDKAPLSPARVPTAAGGRFRVYNISSCHHGVCGHWAVTDLDRQQRFVAGFDPASLHLDRATLQELRAGTVDLIVRGAVARNGSEGATLDAASLEAVAPHRGRPHPATTTQAEEPVIPSPEMSPQPGYLTLPGVGVGPSPFGPAQAAPPASAPASAPFGAPSDERDGLGQQASPYQQGGQY